MNDKIIVKATTGKTAYITLLNSGAHELTADEPLSKGGGDKGVSPDELFCMSLASCTSITLRMYCERKNWDVGDIIVNVELLREENEARLLRKIQFENPVSEEMFTRLISVANKCPMHKTLSGTIRIETEII